MNGLYALMDTLLPFEWLHYTFMKNALIAILLLTPLFGMLGTMAVDNKMAFFSDALGHSALTGIAIGVVLGLITVIIGGVFNIFFDKLTGGSGIAGAAISSVGGNAVATPAALAAVDKSLAATAAIATPQVAAAVVVTAILCPFMTSWISKHTGKEVKTTFSQVEEKVAEENATY